MKSLYFENHSVKEKILLEMFNLVKVFSAFVVILSVVLVTIQVCETTKRDFKLRNIFRFDDKKINKKPKKDVKHLKDFKVHYIPGKNRDNLFGSESQHRIHTLIPLPLPVHLPIPAHPNQHLIGSTSLHIPPPAQPQFPLVPSPHDHVHFHDDAHLHDPYLEHSVHPHIHPHSHEIGSRPLIAEASAPVINPMPPIIVDGFNPIPMTVSNRIEERISYPVFQIIEEKNSVHPNAHFYGNNDNMIRTNFDEYKTHRNNNLFENKHKNPKEHKSVQTTVRLINNDKFNAIHNINTKFDNYFDTNNEESTNSRQFLKSDDKKKGNESTDHKNRSQENELKSSDNRIDEKIYPPPVPDEQVINIVEDQWTFKDLDLWIIR